MATRPGARFMKIMRAGNRIHVAIYRRSRGKFANRIANLPLLLITTYGRKTGNPSTTPVVYLRDGEDYLVSATAGGTDWDPGWYLNLKARPQARIEIGEQAFEVQAVIAAGEERQQLYDRFKAASANFDKYEKGTQRVLPVIRLTAAP
jgi:deazaflavin-dependent oxidoreductase (nitroreductase family)